MYQLNDWSLLSDYFLSPVCLQIYKYRMHCKSKQLITAELNILIRAMQDKGY